MLKWLNPATWPAAIFQMIGGPFVQGAVDAYKAKLAAGNDHDKLAADLAGKELTLQQRELELLSQLRIAQVGKWWEPEKLMGYTVAIYFAKLLIYDKVLALGATDPLAGFAETTASLIVAAYFGKRTVESALRIWRAK